MMLYMPRRFNFEERIAAVNDQHDANRLAAEEVHFARLRRIDEDWKLSLARLYADWHDLFPAAGDSFCSGDQAIDAWLEVLYERGMIVRHERTSPNSVKIWSAEGVSLTDIHSGEVRRAVYNKFEAQGIRPSRIQKEQ